jgi:hypothetical protein
VNETKTVFKWFWAWNDDKEEQWLTSMAQQGWHLKSPGVFGVYTFRKGEPRHIVYRLDFKPASKDETEYLQLFADAGWEYAGTLGGWRYFRKECNPGEEAEIYTDNASKILKYQRVFFFLVILLPIYMTLLITMGPDNQAAAGLDGFYGMMRLVAGLIMLLFAYALVRIFLRINQLKKMD